MSKRNIIIIAVVLICGALGTYFYMDHQNKLRLALEKKIRQETLIVAFDEMPQTLNPLFEQNAAGKTLLDPIFDGMSNRSGEAVRHYQDALAADFIQDETKRNIFTIELDQERRWHDDPNHKVTSKDVRFTVECIKNKKNRSPLRGRINQLIERVDIVDEFTLNVVFKENISAHVVRDLLSFKIIPTTYFGKAMSEDLRSDPVAQEFNRKPIGTGKYQLKKWEGNTLAFSLTQTPAPDEEAEEEDAVENKPGQPIPIQTIESILIHDQEKQVRMLMDGKVDLILEAPTKLHEMMNQQGLKRSDYIPLHFFAVAFNTAAANFTDPKVRQAISRAINRLELAKTIRSDNVSDYVNKGPFPHNDDKRYAKFKDLLSFNLMSAKQLSKKKGTFTATLIYKDDASKTMERLASKIALMLVDIGITVETKGLGMAFETQLTNKNFEMALVRQSGFTDGYNIANLYKSDSPQNITGIGSDNLDSVLDKWENSAFWEQRLPAAKRLHKMLLGMSPYAYLFSLPTSAYYSPRLSEVVIVDPNSLLGSVSNWKVIPE